jgi:hypothetical protein
MSMPEGQCLDLAGLLSSVAAEGRLGGYEVQKRFFEIGSRDGLRDFECYVRQHREAL